MLRVFFLMIMTTFLYADVTFFVATDSHYGANQLRENEDVNKQAIYDMNQLPNNAYPEIFGGYVQIPKALVMTGDLTDAGGYWQWYGLSFFRFLTWDGFISDYGLNGENLLNFPILEGFGNHDLLSWGDWVKSSIKDRNLRRNESIKLSENGLHYSWDWEDVHYIQLNIYPGDTDEAAYSLSFLKNDLLYNLKDRNMPIILFHHYGFDGYSDDWWSSEERQNYFDVIKDYNVVAIFQGHQHDTFHLVWKGLDVFSSGDIQTNEYLVCSIKNNKLKVISRAEGKWGDMYFEKNIIKQ